MFRMSSNFFFILWTKGEIKAVERKLTNPVNKTAYLMKSVFKPIHSNIKYE